jgi:hypothetical protein
MANALSSFLERINSLKYSLESDSVQTRPTATHNREHNSVARILRNGLTVVGFVTLEDFIKQRTSEILHQVGTKGVPFTRLPEKLQSASTHGALKALSFQLKIRSDQQEKLSYIQDHASKIASTTSSAYELSEHTFGYDQSNVGHETILQTLAAFNVDKPWEQITSISSRLGLLGLPAKSTYIGAASRRHKAAHVASADIPKADLEQFIKEAFAIAISYDLLITKALKNIASFDTNYLNGHTKISSSDIEWRVIKKINNEWKEYKTWNMTGRAYRSNRDRDILAQDAKQRAIQASQSLIILNEDNTIHEWLIS